MSVTGWIWKPWYQQQALENAREASTALARRRVEYAEVELFLAAHAERRRAEHIA